jgi:CSLREA domain-containing protein
MVEINKTMHSGESAKIRILLLIIIVFNLMAHASTVGAATITVNTAGDTVANDGLCSLREAIINANNNNHSGSTDCKAGSIVDGVVDKIVFDPDLDGMTIGLSIPTGGSDSELTGDLDITDDLEIIGRGADPVSFGLTYGGKTIISGNAISRLFDIAGVNVTIERLVITNGIATANAVGGADSFGGGIRFYGGDGLTLTLRDVVMMGNRAVSNDTTSAGGAIYAEGDLDLVIENSAIYSNSVVTDCACTSWGGGINIRFGNLTISRSVITGNEATGDVSVGGGISQLFGGDLTITESIISGNSATGDEGGASGGVDITGGAGTAVIDRTVIAGNSADGKSPSAGGLALSIYFDSDVSLTITNSTISGNSAAGSFGNAKFAGGISVSEGNEVTLNNVSLVGNSATSLAASDLDITGGVRVDPAATISLNNTVIIDNTDSTGDSPDCDGTLTSLDYNILGDNSGCDFSSSANDQIGDVAGGGSAIDRADVLEAGDATDNGGGFRIGDRFVHQLSIALAENSLALDAADPATCTDVDQRGAFRPLDGDSSGTAVCDIGAFEDTADQLPQVMFNPTLVDFSVSENAGTFTVRDAVQLSWPSDQQVTVDIVIDPASAAASPADFEFSPMTVVFEPGVTRADIEVAVINDGIAESDETAVFALQNPVAASLGDPADFTVMLEDTGAINDDDEDDGQEDDDDSPSRGGGSGGGGGGSPDWPLFTIIFLMAILKRKVLKKQLIQHQTAGNGTAWKAL